MTSSWISFFLLPQPWHVLLLACYHVVVLQWHPCSNTLIIACWFALYIYSGVFTCLHFLNWCGYYPAQLNDSCVITSWICVIHIPLSHHSVKMKLHLTQLFLSPNSPSLIYQFCSTHIFGRHCVPWNVFQLAYSNFMVPILNTPWA